MEFLKTIPRLVALQVMIWVSAVLLIFFSILPMDGYLKSVIYTLVNTAFYAIIIYINILFLYPVFYNRGSKALYLVLTVFFLLVMGFLRGYATLSLYNYFLEEKQRVIRWDVLVYYVPAGILIFILSHVFRIAIAYFTLKQNTEAIMAEKSKAEFDLLKSRVQPHSLFNTLNNIYYEAYREAPRTADLIGRLSDIMRYFVDESHRDTVSISTEVQFIENYISLENIRLRHGAAISFTKEFKDELRIPPMLLMTLIENIFKHGIDKARLQNDIDISLVQQEGYLYFTTVNNIAEKLQDEQAGGFGIENLRKRLAILYHSDFVLQVNTVENKFTSFLKIPAA